MVICTYNRLKYLKKAIDSLLNQTICKNSDILFEIIIIDNNSNDGTYEYVKELQKRQSVIRYIKEKRQGIGYARNAGLANAQYEIIAYIDDDEQAAMDWAEKILKTFTKMDNVGCVGGPYYLENKNSIPWWIPKSMYTVLGDVHLENSNFEIVEFINRGLCGGNFAVHKEVYEKIGGFPLLGRTDELLLSDEDYLYTKQIYQAGFRVMYNQNAVVHHALIADRLKLSYFLKYEKGMAYTRAKKEKLIKYFFELVWNIIRAPFVIALNYKEGLKMLCRISSSYYKLEKSIKDIYLYTLN